MGVCLGWFCQNQKQLKLQLLKQKEEEEEACHGELISLQSFLNLSCQALKKKRALEAYERSLQDAAEAMGSRLALLHSLSSECVWEGWQA